MLQRVYVPAANASGGAAPIFSSSSTCAAFGSADASTKTGVVSTAVSQMHVSPLTVQLWLADFPDPRRG